MEYLNHKCSVLHSLVFGGWGYASDPCLYVIADIHSTNCNYTITYWIVTDTIKGV